MRCLFSLVYCWPSSGVEPGSLGQGSAPCPQTMITANQVFTDEILLAGNKEAS